MKLSNQIHTFIIKNIKYINKKLKLIRITINEPRTKESYLENSSHC